MERIGGSGVIPKSEMRDVRGLRFGSKTKWRCDCNLALDNYEEMSDRTADPKFLLKKAIELRPQNISSVSRYCL